MGFMEMIKHLFVKNRSNAAATKNTMGKNIYYDEEKIWSVRKDGITITIRWEELISVYIVTTDKGPIEEDVFWELNRNDSTITFPMGVDGEEAFLRRIQTLEGFDNRALIKAMSSVNNDVFLCWKSQIDANA